MPDPVVDPAAGKPNPEPPPGDGDGDTKPVVDPKPPVVDPPPAPVVPESYTDFKVPEGMDLNADLLKNFQTTAKELGLSQENAQKLVDFGSNLVQGGEDARLENRESTLEAWETEIKADEDVGGDKLEETLDRGRRVLRDHGTKELATMLEESGLGSNPHVIRFLVKLDKALGEDKTIDGKPVAPEVDAAAVLYDHK